jgi:hypothetical protein
MVVASVELESREYNNRWYTEARAWKIVKESAGQSHEGVDSVGEEPFASNQGQGTDDLPF